MSRAPLRVSLSGGGSDLPSFYCQDFGQVFSFTINKYVYLACHKLFSGRIHLSYSKSEDVQRVSEIQHPLIRETLRFLNFDEPIEIGSFADVPASGTGLGSSSAFCVALINAIKTYKLENVTSEFLAEAACTIEIEKCLEPIGKQDQYASAFGGLNQFIFNSDHSVEVIPFNDVNTTNFLDKSLLLYYLGSGRASSSILQTQNEAMRESKNSYDAVVTLRDMVNSMISAVRVQDAGKIGELLRYSWIEKSKLADKISNSEIDLALEIAIKNGALGGKVVGAGGGGFLLLAVEPDDRAKFMTNYSILRNLPFEITSKGAEIVYSDEFNG